MVSGRSEEHTSEFQSPCNLVCRLLLEKKKGNTLSARSTFGLAGCIPRHNHSADAASAHRCGKCPGVCRAPDERPGNHDCLFFNDTATTEIYTLSLHDALPI